MENEDLRIRFRPDEIRVLFVGESVPDSGKFFYKGDSQMYRYFERIVGQKLFGSSNNFLNNFKDSGCYLDDLVLTPVNKISPNKRKQASEQAIPGLAKRIRDYEPQIVVALLKGIEEFVRKAVVHSGVDSCFFATHFPGNGQQNKFECDIARILPELKKT